MFNKIGCLVYLLFFANFAVSLENFDIREFYVSAKDLPHVETGSYFFKFTTGTLNELGHQRWNEVVLSSDVNNSNPSWTNDLFNITYKSIYGCTASNYCYGSWGIDVESTSQPQIHQHRQLQNTFRLQQLSSHRGDRPSDEALQSTSQNKINHNNQQIIEIEIGNSEVTTESTKMQISPGEPVPPGFEDVVRPVAELQVILSKYRTSPLIGLEYIIELIMGERRPRTYHCALCDKICDTKDIIDHIKSYEHRCKYLEKHFSTVMVSLSQYRQHKNAKSVLSSVIEDVCDSIEVAYGRMVPNVFENSDYTTNRAVYMKKLARERHFDEKSGSTFAGGIDHKAIQSAFETLAQNKTNNATNTSIAKRSHIETTATSKRKSFDSISSSDSMSSRAKGKKVRSFDVTEPVVIDKINLDLISSDSDEDSADKKRKKSNFHKSSNYTSSIYSKNDETDEFKYERYRSLTEQAVENLKMLLKEYEKYPEKHPLYPSEWKRYWSRRSKELESVGMNPLTFDFSSEWSKYWLRRLRELYDDEIALKKFEIRKKLNLSADYYPRSSSSIYNEPSSSFSSYSKDDTRIEKSQMMSHHPVDQVEEDVDGEPLTVISVLRLLAALEDLLGATLGKKVLDLLSKAVHLEKLKANLADDVLMNEENSVLLATVKEKLKGLIIAKIVNNQQKNAVRRAIRNVESIVVVIDNKIAVGETRDEGESHQSVNANVSNDLNRTDKPQSRRDSQQKLTKTRKYDSRAEIREQIATGFLIQKINISNERLEELLDIYVSQSRDTSETPYLFGVRVSQTENLHQSSHTQSQMNDANSKGCGNGFGSNFYDRNVENVSSSDNSSFNAGNCHNFNNRTNNSNDAYSQQNSNQPNNLFRSHDNSQFNQQNVSYNRQMNRNSQQRFQQQSATSVDHQHHTSSNSSNKHKNIPSLMQIWDAEPMMGNQSNSRAFGKNTKINSIWETNPMQQQQQQQQQQQKQQQQQPQYNQGSFQQQNQQQSQYNNFSKYAQNQHGTTSHPVWDKQFSQQQNNRNSRHH